MSDIQKEKQLIYDLLRKLIDERRELNKQYEELKQRLDNLNSMEQVSAEILPGNKKNISVLEKEKTLSKDYLFRKNKTQHYVSFDRVSKNILSILKQSPVPLSNQQLLKK
ncbi:hypothetical protein HB955_08350 [Listeria welshimeri]|nr:hypothetical protein [Listeria welshimeri]